MTATTARPAYDTGHAPQEPEPTHTFDADSDILESGKNPALPPNHPINALSPTRKWLILVTLSYAGLLGNFAAAIILVAFVPIAADFGKRPGDIPSTIGYALLGIAVGPFLWNPFSKTLGRRAVYLAGSFLTIPCCIWLAEARSFGSFAAGRAVAGVLSSWSQTVPPSTVADIFVSQVRGTMMSLYAVAVVVAPAIAPFFSGVIVNAASWRVLFWFVLGLSGLQFVMFLVFVPETMWVEDEEHPGVLPNEKVNDVNGVKAQPRSGRVGAAWMPWERPRDFLAIFLSPIQMMKYIPITLPSFYYGTLFAWSVGITVVVPQILERPPYSFATIPVGCSFLAFGVGGLLGKWSGGVVGDRTVAYFERQKRNGRREPEDRLWALLPVLPLKFTGLITLGGCIQHSRHWMGILVGGAIYYFSLSATTGILQTYTLECYLARSGDCGVVFTFWKMIWGFAVAYFAMEWAERDGFLAAYAIQGALALGLGAAVCTLLIWKGRDIRDYQGMPLFER